MPETLEPVRFRLDSEPTVKEAPIKKVDTQYTTLVFNSQHLDYLRQKPNNDKYDALSSNNRIYCSVSANRDENGKLIVSGVVLGTYVKINDDVMKDPALIDEIFHPYKLVKIHSVDRKLNDSELWKTYYITNNEFVHTQVQIANKQFMPRKYYEPKDHISCLQPGMFIRVSDEMMSGKITLQDLRRFFNGHILTLVDSIDRPDWDGSSWSTYFVERNDKYEEIEQLTHEQFINLAMRDNNFHKYIGHGKVSLYGTYESEFISKVSALLRFREFYMENNSNKLIEEVKTKQDLWGHPGVPSP